MDLVYQRTKRSQDITAKKGKILKAPFGWGEELTIKITCLLLTALVRPRFPCTIVRVGRPKTQQGEDQSKPEENVNMQRYDSVFPLAYDVNSVFFELSVRSDNQEIVQLGCSNNEAIARIFMNFGKFC